MLILDPSVHFRNLQHHENDTKDMTAVIQALGVIRDATGVAIVTLHHPPKYGTGGRENTVIRNELDAELSLEGVGTEKEYNAPGGRLTLDWTKPPRYGAKPPTIYLIRGDNGLLEQTDDRPVSSKAQERMDQEQTILDVLRAGRMTVKELRERLLVKNVVMSLSTLRNRTADMAERGRLERAGGTKRGQTCVLFLPAKPERNPETDLRTSYVPDLTVTDTEEWDA